MVFPNAALYFFDFSIKYTNITYDGIRFRILLSAPDRYSVQACVQAASRKVIISIHAYAQAETVAKFLQLGTF